LGLAFHPDYANNGWFFVNYTDLAGDTVVARFQVTADPDIAGAASEQIILQIPQPFPNHNGGWLGFGPGDGFLYIATGDGGGSGGPLNNGQNTARLLGKMLRIDVDTASPFAIPPDNPFVGVAGALDEIWAFGLRNPWRCAFDSETGELFIADVGQDVVEEIDVQPAASPGGENYGWRCREGGNCFDPACCNNAGFTDPVHTYTHGGLPFRCSITGGEVYRGCAIEGLAGTYFFADLCSNQIWSFRFNGSVVGFQERTAELAPGGGLNISGVSSFGRDALGELYIVDLFDGEVFKIIPDPSTFVPDCNRNNRADACDLITGEGTDADGNGVLDQCEVVVPVPTLGTWGVMLLALLVVAAGTVLITRRVET
ncbi:MAG: IPTL-CTERM sorting domain-containing protein, partial [Phycisphaerae bacterium]